MIYNWDYDTISLLRQKIIKRMTGPQKNIAFGISYYFSGHDLKIQADVNSITKISSVNALAHNSVLVRFQTDFTF